jgi:hypothetical protein
MVKMVKMVDVRSMIKGHRELADSTSSTQSAMPTPSSTPSAKARGVDLSSSARVSETIGTAPRRSESFHSPVSTSAIARKPNTTTEASMVKESMGGLPKRSVSFQGSERFSLKENHQELPANKMKPFEGAVGTESVAGLSQSVSVSAGDGVQGVSTMSDEDKVIDRDNLYAYVSRLCQDNPDPAKAYAELMRFMSSCVLLIQPFLPEVGANALSKALNFWNGEDVPASELDSARVACWEFLDAKGGSTSVADKEDAAMRALIWVLYPKPNEEIGLHEISDYFSDMMDSIGDYAEGVESMMDE